MLATLLGVLALTSVACSFGSLSISGNTATVEINLPEDQINEWIERSVTQVNDSSDEIFKRVTEVEMRDGYIRVFGIAEDEGGNEVEGSFDLSIGVEDDILQVAIIAVDIPGWSMDDARIARLNREMQEGLEQSVLDSNGQVRYLEAEVSEESLRLKVETTLDTH